MVCFGLDQWNPMGISMYYVEDYREVIDYFDFLLLTIITIKAIVKNNIKNIIGKYSSITYSLKCGVSVLKNIHPQIPEKSWIPV